MKAYLLVFLGAGLGGALRHSVNCGCARMCGTAFPWGTLMVNIVGSFLMGAVVAWFAFKAGEGWSQPVRLFMTTGILGGFTTFSAFSLDAVQIWGRGQVGLSVAYVAASVLFSIAGLVAGLALIRSLTT